MYKNSISVVIPAFNEQDNIRKVIENSYNFLKANFDNFELIIVDDGSTDNTHFICRELSTKIGDKLVVLRHVANRGYGAALRTGLFSAKNDLVFYTDSDNQFDINELKSFLEYIKDFDVIIGYRKNRKDIFIRKFCALIYNRIIFFLFGLNVRDIDCSFKLFKRESLSKLSIDTDEFLIDTELLVKSKLNNLKVKQIGVNHLPRTSGKSTVKFSHVFGTIRDMGYLYKKVKGNKS